ncbi:DUF7000 family protein [Chloroflexota bacterium]
MESFAQYMNEYRNQLEEGHIKQAYAGLMQYIMDLRTHFAKKYSSYFVSGSIYQGYMDMTYFSFSPASLKNHKLKIAIVFVYDTFRFEVWLSGYNRSVQAQYLKLLNESNWNKYHVATTAKGTDSIIDHVLVDNPDFGDLNALTGQIESGALGFTRDIENFLSKH